MFRPSLTAFALAAVFALSACAAESDDSAAQADEQDFTVEKTLPIKVAKTFTKTVSFSQDYGSGADHVAATAIVTVSGKIALDTKLGVSARTKAFRLDSFTGDLTGAWEADADLDVRLQLTGKGANNEDLVRKLNEEAEDHLLNGQVSLLYIPIPIGADLGSAKLQAGIEVQLGCKMDAQATFNAHASAGMDGALDFGLEWRKNTFKDAKGVDQHWKFEKKLAKPTFHPPKLDVAEGKAKFHAKCALKPSVNLELDVGAGFLASAELGAKLAGEVYATADGSIDSKQRSWAADYDIGVAGSFEVYAEGTLLGHEMKRTKSFPIFGGPSAPLHLGKQRFQGTLPEADAP